MESTDIELSESTSLKTGTNIKFSYQQVGDESITNHPKERAYPLLTKIAITCWTILFIFLPILFLSIVLKYFHYTTTNSLEVLDGISRSSSPLMEDVVVQHENTHALYLYLASLPLIILVHYTHWKLHIHVHQTKARSKNLEKQFECYDCG